MATESPIQQPKSFFRASNLDYFASKVGQDLRWSAIDALPIEFVHA
jgi:hypothetical protein